VPTFLMKPIYRYVTVDFFPNVPTILVSTPVIIIGFRR